MSYLCIIIPSCFNLLIHTRPMHTYTRIGQNSLMINYSACTKVIVAIGLNTTIWQNPMKTHTKTRINHTVASWSTTIKIKTRLQNVMSSQSVNLWPKIPRTTSSTSFCLTRISVRLNPSYPWMNWTELSWTEMNCELSDWLNMNCELLLNWTELFELNCTRMCELLLWTGVGLNCELLIEKHVKVIFCWEENVKKWFGGFCCAI